MRNKLPTVFLITLTSAIAGSVYGILLNQFNYSVSPEFFTKDMFYRFRLDNYFEDSPRTGVTIVGFLSSWWVSLGIGFTLSLVSLLFDDWRPRIRQTLKAISLIIFCTFLTPFLIVSGWFLKDYLSLVSYEQYAVIPAKYAPKGTTIQDPYSFYAVAIINNFSYVGGFIGLTAGIVYLIWKYKKSCQPRI